MDTSLNSTYAGIFCPRAFTIETGTFRHGGYMIGR